MANELDRLYQSYIAFDVEDRVDVLGNIIKELTLKAAELSRKFGDDDRKKIARADKSLQLAAGSKTPDEMESASLAVVRLYEAVLRPHGHTLDIRDFSARLVAERESIQQQREYLTNRYSAAISGLNTVFEFISVRFAVDLRAQNAVARIDPTRKGCVFLSTDFCEDLLKGMASKGVFHTVAIDVLPLAVKASAIEGAEINGEKVFENLERAMVALMAFIFSENSQKNPDKPIEHTLKKAVVKNVPKVNTDPRIKYPNVWFRGGAAVVYNLLAISSDIDLDINELRADSKLDISKDDLLDILDMIERKGDETGYWSLMTYASGRVSFEWN